MSKKDDFIDKANRLTKDGYVHAIYLTYNGIEYSVGGYYGFAGTDIKRNEVVYEEWPDTIDDVLNGKYCENGMSIMDIISLDDSKWDWDWEENPGCNAQ